VSNDRPDAGEPAAPTIPVTAEIVTIGDELVLGESLDTNGRDLARALRTIGVAVTRQTTVGDAVEGVAAVIREAAARARIVVTTGGLGPTFDDPTREAAALAAGVPTVFQPDLWASITTMFERFGRVPTDNNRAQAFVPFGAHVIPNPVGTAPAFALDVRGACVICLPGVPREMRYLTEHAVLPLLVARFDLTERLWLRTLHCAGIGESALDAAIHDVVTAVPQGGALAVGLAAHLGVVDVRLTARAASAAEADGRIAPVEAAIRERLGDAVFGADDDTLPGVVAAALAARGWRIAGVEAGVGGALAAALAGAGDVCAGVEVVTDTLSAAALEAAVAAARRSRSVEVVVGVSLRRAGDPAHPLPEAGRIDVCLATPHGTTTTTLTHAGHPDSGPSRAVAAAVDGVRRTIG